MKSGIWTLFLILAVVCSSYAEEVDNSAVKTFVDGTPALAEEVNGNFQALIDAINDNAERLAELEAAVAAAGSNDISGGTFEVHQMGIINRGDGEFYSSTGNVWQKITITFNANGTFSVNGAESESELNTDNNELTLLIQNDPVSVTGTYTQNGSHVTTSEEDFSFTVSADGNILVFSEFAFSPFDSAQESESSLVIAVRTN